MSAVINDTAIRTVLIELEEAYSADTAFKHLRTSGIRYVPGTGVLNPSVMLVGEAPGAQENTRGEPFVGPAGRVLRDLMRVAGLYVDRNAFLTNVVKYRPPGNRTPVLAEIQASRPYLRREWKAVGKPSILVAIGGVAWQATGPPKPGGILVNAGKPVTRKNPPVWTIVPMVHPAFALRNNDYRPKVERHWELFGQWLKRKGIVE